VLASRSKAGEWWPYRIPTPREVALFLEHDDIDIGEEMCGTCMRARALKQRCPFCGETTRSFLDALTHERMLRYLGGIDAEYRRHGR
jgi:hypothetical protein